MVRLPFNWAGSSNDPNRKRSSDSSRERKPVPRDFKDYYHILAVPRNATMQQIEQAYGKLVQKYGPHVSIDECDPDTQIKMMRTINEAYQILMNPSRRRMHDVELTRYFGSEDVRKMSKRVMDEKQSSDN